MMLLYFFTALFVIYSSIVIGSILKFRHNGIGLNVKYKALISVFPLIIFFLHTRVAIGEFKHDKKKSLRIMTVMFTKYPILLAILIELILESMAECDVFGDSKMLQIKEKPAKKSLLSDVTFPNFKTDEILSYFKQKDFYEDLLLKNII